MKDFTKNILLWIVIVVVMLAIWSRYSPSTKAAAAYAARTNCLVTSSRAVICPPPSGSIALDASGRAVCGRGECLQSAKGEWLCSTETGGHAGRKGNTGIACTGGCEPAAADRCEVAR